MSDDFNPEITSVDPNQGELPLEGGETNQPSAPVEPSDNAERSQLGRRVQRMEESLKALSTLESRLGRMMEMMEQGSAFAPPQKHPWETGQPEEMPQYINTPEDFEKYERIKRQKEAAESEHYQRGYVGYIRSRGLKDVSTPPDLQSEIEKELLITGRGKYLRHTNDPIRDAEINYGLAKAEVLSRRYSTDANRPNVRGDRPNPPAGVTASTRTAAPPSNNVELDEYSRKFIQALGKDPNDPRVQGALKK